MNMSHYLDVCAYLRDHNDRWVTWKELHAYCGVGDRELREIKAEAINNDIMMASGDRGYRIVDKYEDMQEMVGRMRSQINNMSQQIRKIEDKFGHRDQISLEVA